MKPARVRKNYTVRDSVGNILIFKSNPDGDLIINDKNISNKIDKIKQTVENLTDKVIE